MKSIRGGRSLPARGECQGGCTQEGGEAGHVSGAEPVSPRRPASWWLSLGGSTGDVWVPAFNNPINPETVSVPSFSGLTPGDDVLCTDIFTKPHD